MSLIESFFWYSVLYSECPLSERVLRWRNACVREIPFPEIKLDSQLAIHVELCLVHYKQHYSSERGGGRGGIKEERESGVEWSREGEGEGMRK